MDRRYEWIFALQDRVSPTLAAISSHYSGTVSRMASMSSRFRSMFSGATQSVEELRRRLDGLKGRRDLMVDTRQIRAANREIQQLEQRMNNLQNAGRRNSASGSEANSGGGLMGLARGALPALGIAGLIAGAGSLAKAGMDRQQVEVSFEQFVGKAGVGNMMGQLNKFADVTPYSNDDVYGAGRNLLAAKVGPDQLNKTLTDIGNMAAVSQKDFGDMTKAYANTKQKGFVDNGDLNDQFGGTAVRDQLMKNLGVDGEKLFKMAEGHKIKFSDLQTAIQDLSEKGGLYEGGLEKLSNTAGGKLSTFMGTMENKIAEWAKSQNGNLAKLFDFGSEFLSKMGPLEDAVGRLLGAFAPLGDTLYGLMGTLGFVGEKGTGVETVINMLTGAVNLLTYAVEVFTSPFGQVVLVAAGAIHVFGLLNEGLVLLQARGITSVATGLQALWGIMLANPITTILVGVAAIGVAIKYLWDNCDGFRYGLIKLWEVGKAVFTGLGKAKDAFLAGSLDGIKAAFSDSWTQGLKNAEAAIAADKKARSATAPATPKTAAQTGAGMPKGATGTKAGADGDKTKSKKDLDATTGGTKSTTINITIGKLVEKLDIHSTTMQGGLQDLESQITDTLLRVLYSAKAVGD